MPDWRQFPTFVILLLIFSGLMQFPAVHAAVGGNWPVARDFFYHSLFFLAIAIILGLATQSWSPRRPARYHLMTLLLCYTVLPLMLAAPIVGLIPGIGLGDAYFEMLSCLTTTGATLFDRPRLLPDAVHLWRSIVAWFGGLIVLVTAFAILAPLNLGGFEIGGDGAIQGGSRAGGSVEEATARIVRQFQLIMPVYAALTILLGLILVVLGDRPFVAATHAMAALSTSGVSPIGGLDGSESGRLGELALVLFLLPAVSQRGMRLGFSADRRPALGDPQVQLMLISVLSITLLLFLRSFIGAIEIERQDNLQAAVQAVWGSMFTVLSYLTTTGFESRDWRAMQIWSDLPDPGTILLGVAVMGGGIATTAGGVKLLRIYALYRHGVRELDRLVHPNSLGSHGEGDRLISPRGTRIAFLFLMLFLVSLALLMIALSVTGLDFEHSMALAVAALTTTGPAIQTVGSGVGYGDLGGFALGILCVGMIVGRMEALVIIALFNPALWRS